MKENRILIVIVLASTAWLTGAIVYTRAPAVQPVEQVAVPASPPPVIEAEKPAEKAEATVPQPPRQAKKWVAKEVPEGTTKDELDRRIAAFDEKVAATPSHK